MDWSYFIFMLHLFPVEMLILHYKLDFQLIYVGINVDLLLFKKTVANKFDFFWVY